MQCTSDTRWENRPQCGTAVHNSLGFSRRQVLVLLSTFFSLASAHALLLCGIINSCMKGSNPDKLEHTRYKRKKMRNI